MVSNEYLWNDNYNVGNEFIDNAHKKLFSILRHIWNKENLDENKKEWVCVETIKFLKSYTLRHFAEEEAFMREVGYEGYEAHKKLHDNMRDVTIPEIELELKENNYSDESLGKLVAVMSGWLTGHIIIEDQAITGKRKSIYASVDDIPDARIKSTKNVIDERVGNLNSEFCRFMKEFFIVSMNLENNSYNYEEIENSKAIRMEYKTGEGTHTVTFIAQNSLILHMASKILGVKVYKLDKNALVAYSQMLITCGKAAVCTVTDRTDVEFIKIYSYTVDENSKTESVKCGLYWNSFNGGAAITIL